MRPARSLRRMRSEVSSPCKLGGLVDARHQIMVSKPRLTSVGYPRAKVSANSMERGRRVAWDGDSWGFRYLPILKVEFQDRYFRLRPRSRFSGLGRLHREVSQVRLLARRTRSVPSPCNSRAGKSSTGRSNTNTEPGRSTRQARSLRWSPCAGGPSPWRFQPNFTPQSPAVRGILLPLSRVSLKRTTPQPSLQTRRRTPPDQWAAPVCGQGHERFGTSQAKWRDSQTGRRKAGPLLQQVPLAAPCRPSDPMLQLRKGCVATHWTVTGARCEP